MVLKICTKEEIQKYFSKDMAGGFSASRVIKLFILPNQIEDEEECAVQILNHEILHQVLGKVIGQEARIKLDKVHRHLYVLDLKTNKHYHIVGFVQEKKGRMILIN